MSPSSTPNLTVPSSWSQNGCWSYIRLIQRQGRREGCLRFYQKGSFLPQKLPDSLIFHWPGLTMRPPLGQSSAVIQGLFCFTSWIQACCQSCKKGRDLPVLLATAVGTTDVKNVSWVNTRFTPVIIHQCWLLLLPPCSVCFVDLAGVFSMEYFSVGAVHRWLTFL